MKRLIVGLLVLTGISMFTACSTSSAGTHASAPQQGKIHIDVLSDRGDPSAMESKQWRYRNQVGEYMEPNLVRRLKDYKFTSSLIQDETERASGDNCYLLKVEITSYNPGSSAARMLVGFGAGACALDCRYELIDAGGNQVLAWTDGIGTSGDWRRLPRALNKKVGKKLSDHFGR